jgi:hypothetical protein
MDAKEIRSREFRPYNSNNPAELVTMTLRCAEMMREIAAQFAEANEHLVKIANPMFVYDGPRWAWLTHNGKPFVIDAREVTGVAPLDTGIGSDKPTACIGMKGQPWSKTVDGTVEKICKRLGIPMEE